jgi:hypothetical protein
MAGIDRLIDRFLEEKTGCGDRDEDETNPKDKIR